MSSKYPSIWGETSESTVGQLILDLNGDCGWGYSGDWIDPNSAQCDGVYAYDDETCDVECVITEGIYWALTSVLGSQNYTARAEEISSEWLMAYPTNVTECEPQPYCEEMDKYAADLYTLLTSYDDWAWIPSKLPDGNYSKLPDSAAVGVLSMPIVFVLMVNLLNII